VLRSCTGKAYIADRARGCQWPAGDQRQPKLRFVVAFSAEASVCPRIKPEGRLFPEVLRPRAWHRGSKSARRHLDAAAALAHQAALATGTRDLSATESFTPIFKCLSAVTRPTHSAGTLSLPPSSHTARNPTECSLCDRAPCIERWARACKSVHADQGARSPAARRQSCPGDCGR
jgi:hypothetical protein